MKSGASRSMLPTAITSSSKPLDKADMRNLAIVGMAIFCVVTPLEISQLLFALLGALGYLLLQYMQPAVDERHKNMHKQPKPQRARPTDPHSKQMVCERHGRSATLRQAGSTSPTATVQPVSAPKFANIGFHAEVDEFLGQISPSMDGDAVVAQIARRVKQSIRHIIPEAEVTGFAAGNVLSSGAFGVAVPEVDIVIGASTRALQSRLMCRGSQGGYTLEGVKLKKSAIRSITDRLVGSGAFKFRRSAFRGDEPKVILIAPAMLGKDEITIPVSVSVNAVTPMCSAALITECGRKDSRARDLILLVRRWAKDRGLSHATKGHFSPHVWTLLAIYFLQVDDRDEGPLLPSLDAFEKSSTLPGVWLKSDPEGVSSAVPQGADGKRSVAALFQDLVYFYNATFDWQGEAVSVRLGRRAAPDASLPLHIILEKDGCGSFVGPSVEDPFVKGANLGDCMTAESFGRLQEEFARATNLCERGVSLTELLQPWVPPDVQAIGLES